MTYDELRNLIAKLDEQPISARYILPPQWVVDEYGLEEGDSFYGMEVVLVDIPKGEEDD